MTQRRIGILCYDGIQALDVTGPSEVFSLASRARGGDGYAIELVAPEALPLRTSSGLQLVPDCPLEACRGPLDTRRSARP